MGIHDKKLSCSEDVAWWSKNGCLFLKEFFEEELEELDL